MKDQRITDIILTHHFELYHTVAQQCGGRSESTNAYEWALAAPGNDYPNFIFNEQEALIDPTVLKKQLEQEILPSFWLSPNASLEKTIRPFGFRKIQQWQAMAMSQDDLLIPPQPPGLVYKIVQEELALKAWTQLMATAFNARYQSNYFYPLLNHQTFEFLIFHNSEGIPVATTLNFYKDDIVGVHMVATHPNYRKLGIGQWAFSQSIQHAFEQGMNGAICTAVPKGVNAWKGIGFNVYDMIYLYWRMSKSRQL